MSFYGYYRNSGIPRLLSFDEANKLYEDTKPIKERKGSRYAGKRPLGHRNRMWFQIDKENEGADNEAIVCSMYDEPIVKYFKNGEIEIRNYSYNSTSTSNFIGDLFRNWSGVLAYVFDHAMLITIKCGVKENGLPIQKYQKLHPKESMRIRRKVDMREGDYWEVIDHKPVVVHTLDRKALKEVKQKYEGLYTFARQYAKLMGGEITIKDTEFETRFTQEEHEKLWYFRLDGGWWSGLNAFADSVNVLKGWLKDMPTDEARIYNYISLLTLLGRRSNVGVYNWNTNTTTASDVQLMRGIDKLLVGLYRNDVMVATECVDTLKRDRYGYLYRRGWAKYYDEAGYYTPD